MNKMNKIGTKLLEWLLDAEGTISTKTEHAHTGRIKMLVLLLEKNILKSTIIPN